MKLLRRTISVMALAALPAMASAETGPTPTTQEQRVAEIRAMHWSHEGNLTLARSHSSFALPAGFSGVVGADANRLVELANARSDKTADAYLVDSSNHSEVLLEYFDSGYVTLDDLGQINASEMLAQIKQATEDSNADRRAANIEEMHVTGWLQEPTFDHATNTAYWALAAATPSHGLVNAVALRLGRNGYEKFTWIVPPEEFRPASGTLDAALKSHTFDPDYRYSDHLSTDKVAGYGIAALIGAVAGAKVVKIAAAGGLLLLLKKLWVVPLLLFGGAFGWLKRFFRRGSANGKT
jgi:uncharacterized membrane-anchored protein